MAIFWYKRNDKNGKVDASLITFIQWLHTCTCIYIRNILKISNKVNIIYQLIKKW